MFGSGAFFFAFQPKKALINDKNKDLIAFFRILKENGENLINELSRLNASKEYYYQLRDSHPLNDFERAIRFIYLNRLCWNGVFRVNKHGKFNVPIGDRLPKKLWDEDILKKIQILLNNAVIFNVDFADLDKFIENNDFVFWDPPYPKNSKKRLGFNRYINDFFLLDDHKRLANLINKLHDTKVKIMLTLGNNEELLSLYPSFLKKIKIESKSLISCTGEKRGHVTEFILLNY